MAWACRSTEPEAPLSPAGTPRASCGTTTAARDITETPGGAIRILLTGRRSLVRVRSDQPWQAVNETVQPETAVALVPDAEYVVRATPTGADLMDEAGAVVAQFGGSFAYRPTTPPAPSASAPRGTVARCAPCRAAGASTSWNVVGLEQYLYGVVPRGDAGQVGG